MAEQYLVAKIAVSGAVYSIDKPYDYYVPAEQQAVARVGQRVIVPFGKGNKKAEGFILALELQQARDKLKYIHHIFDDAVVLSQEDISLALWMRQRYFCTFFEAANAMLPPGVWNKNAEVYTAADLPQEQALELAGTSRKKKRIVQVLYETSHPMTEAELAKACESDRISTELKQLVACGALQISQQIDKKIHDRLIWQVRLVLPLEQVRLQIGSGRYSEKRLEIIECVAQAGEIPEKEVCYLTGCSSAMIRHLVKLGILKLEKAEVYRRPHIRKGEAAGEICLNLQQQATFDALADKLDGKPHAVLLHGVTGSGKTMVYIKLIRQVIESGRNAILLVPEIALTPQMVRQFYQYFRQEVAVIHSALTSAQRYDEYKRIKAGKARIVIGTRTAVFAPLNNIGVIILDEEQEYTYKSDSTPRYHAREVAKYRAVKHNSLLIFGSATPSVESYYHAKTGKYSLVEIDRRYHDVPLPRVILSDMRGQLRQGEVSNIGDTLLQELQANLNAGEQSILFINRRGNARMVACVDCGYIPQCENCSVALTYHSKNGRLMCHHCGHSQPMLTVCPQCGGDHIKTIGTGTQKIEEELQGYFPEAQILRMDADTTTQRTSHEKLLDQFASGKADILLGTQMVSKGLDFPNVTLVGVLDADLSLYCGDYHAQERTFSLLTQVVGRAGRREKPGRAVVQTYTPQNPVILAAAEQDYQAFYEYEIQSRQALELPPFSDVFVFCLSGIHEDDVLRAALSLSATITKAFSGDYRDLSTQVLGPVSAPIARLNRRFRYTVSFRGKDDKRTRELIARVVSAFYASPYSRMVALAADINPYQ